MDIIWKDVPGLDNRFKANSNGNIWDKVENDWVPYYFMSIRGYYTKGSKKPSGFGYLAFCYKGKNHRVHRVIAETFIPNPNNLPCVNHLNENPSDNRVENLRWATHKENMNNLVRNASEIYSQVVVKPFHYRVTERLLSGMPLLCTFGKCCFCI